MAASLATVLSIQACIGKRQANVTYSAQRIWDCYGGDCALGVHSPLIETFFPYILMHGVPSYLLSHHKQRTWVSRMDAETPEHITESNYTQCASMALQSSPGLLSVQAHRNIAANQNNASANMLHRQALKEHLWHTHHPVMAVARMTPTRFEDFVVPYTRWQMQTEAAFELGAPGRALHALTVLGWRDTDGAWLVQNSMGPGWQNDGIGWVLGSLEDEWYGFQLASDHSANGTALLTKTTAPPKQTLNQEVDLPFYLIMKPSNAHVGHDTQVDLIVFLLTCMSVGCLAWLLCFFMR